MAYLITPTDLITGAKAPGIISFSDKTDTAIMEAENKSNLSKYDRWSFNIDVVHIKDKVVKKRWNDESD
jgi:hypothetical protein